MLTLRQASEQLEIGLDVIDKIARTHGIGTVLGKGMPRVLTPAEIKQLAKIATQRSKPGRKAKS